MLLPRRWLEEPRGPIYALPDTRTKEQLKRDGDYTPARWRKLKVERGWELRRHGQRKPRKWRENRRRGGSA